MQLRTEGIAEVYKNTYLKEKGVTYWELCKMEKKL